MKKDKSNAEGYVRILGHDQVVVDDSGVVVDQGIVVGKDAVEGVAGEKDNGIGIAGIEDIFVNKDETDHYASQLIVEDMVVYETRVGLVIGAEYTRIFGTVGYAGL